MKYYVNDGLAITHSGKMYTEGKELPAEELGEKHVKVLLKEGSLIDERAYKKKFGPTEEELKAEAEAEAKAEMEKAAAKKKVEAGKDKRKELVKVAAELGIKRANRMKEKELIEAIKRHRRNNP